MKLSLGASEVAETIIWQILLQVTVVLLLTTIGTASYGACWKIAEVDFNRFINHTASSAFLQHTRNVLCMAKGPDPEQRLESFLQQNKFFLPLQKAGVC